MNLPDQAYCEIHPKVALVSRNRRDGKGSFWACPLWPECNYILRESKIPPKAPPRNATSPVGESSGSEQPFHTLEDVYVLLERIDKRLSGWI